MREHPMVRIERDGLLPVGRRDWLFRHNRDWHQGTGKRVTTNGRPSRVAGKWYSNPTRHKRYDVLADGLGSRLQRPGSRPTGRSTAIRRLLAEHRSAKALAAHKPHAGAGTCAHHLATCQDCASGTPCEHGKVKFGL